MKNYINLHILSSLAFANPNRDDAGAPKTAYYGGVERARMSSQSLKRAARIAFEEKTQAKTVRSSKVAELVAVELEAQGHSVSDKDWELIDQCVRTLVENGPKVKKRVSEDADVEESGDTLMWVSSAEVSAMAGALLPVVTGKTKYKEKDVRKSMQEAVDEPSLSIAAFGRMFAASVENAVDASVQVSHALSTHTHAIEVDYFTALDDMQAHGAGHIGLNMFTGAVYYRHICIDRAQLAANCGEKLESMSEELSDFISALLLELPRGKQTTTAHQSLPSAILAIEGSRPANFVEAFERPVSSIEGYVGPSVDALASYVEDIKSFAPEIFGDSWFAGKSEFVDKFPDAQLANLGTIVKEIASWVGKPAR